MTDRTMSDGSLSRVFLQPSSLNPALPPSELLRVSLIIVIVIDSVIVLVLVIVIIIVIIIVIDINIIIIVFLSFDKRCCMSFNVNRYEEKPRKTEGSQNKKGNIL